MTTSLFDYQADAVKKLRTGSILVGGVGSGKSRTAIAYFFENERPKDLYIITTAAKRDTLDWEGEAAQYGLTAKVDSWNRIKEYVKVSGAFFIFDEQRLVGSGSWVKSFLKIVKNNNWILLSATPGDTWLDYIPVFIANGFYKNRTEFLRRHVVYNTFTKFPKVDHYVEIGALKRFKARILVDMAYRPPVDSSFIDVVSDYDLERFKLVSEKRWNPYTDLPIKDVTELFFTMRKVVNSDPSRLGALKTIIQKHRRVIVFYNFNYELEILRTLKDTGVTVGEYNGYKHDPVPSDARWVYLVQYMSGAEGWNCIETNAMVFYSQNYSYRVMTQAAGRINRLNTTFAHLFYYTLLSESKIDIAIKKALKNKKKFNERKSGFINFGYKEG